MKPIVIFGIGGFGELVHYYFTHDTDRKIAGFTVDREYLKEAQFCGLPVVPFDEVEKHFPPGAYEMIICVGYSNLAHIKEIAHIRKAKFDAAQKKGYTLASYVSSKISLWPNNKIGSNAIIMEHSIIQPFVSIGHNVVLFGGCVISHHTVIEDHCFLAPGVTLAGKVFVGEGSFIGIGAEIGPYICVQKNSIIGAGSTIIN